MSLSAESATHKRPKSRSDNAYPRKRALQACQTCRARRTKCDNGRPRCAACQVLGAECSYREKDNSSLDQGTLTILERLDGLEAILLSPTRTAAVSASPTGRPYSDRPVQQPTLSPLNFSSPVLEDESDSFPHSVTVEGVLSWSLWSDRFAAHPTLKQLFIGRQDQGSPPVLTRTINDDAIVGEDKLIRNYFETFHIFNPVVDERKIDEYRRNVQLRGYGWDAESCLLLLVFAIGNMAEAEPYWANAGSSSDWKQSNAFRNAESCFISAQKRFALLLSNAGVLEAQCLFLSGVYLMSTLRPLSAWRMFVQAVACCQTFHPLPHRSQEESPAAKQERSVQDSIYWTCFKSELELRLELHVSETALRDFKYPAFFPSPPEDLKVDSEPAWYFYLAEIALQRLRGRILYHAYKCQVSGLTVYDMIDMVLNFEQQAREWMSSLPPTLALDGVPSTGQPGHAEHHSLRLILRSHLIDCFEVMYWPFLREIINMDFDKSNLPVVQQPMTTVLSFAQKGLDVCIDRIEQTESGFRSRHHGTWLTLRSCTRSAFVLMAVRHVDVQSPELGKFLRVPGSLVSCVNKVMFLLGFWQHESGDVEDRLGILEQLMAEGSQGS